jgi:hypothetical protein
MITIFKDNKMYAIQTLEQWWVVEKDCVYCGECCLDRGESFVFADDEGRCTKVRVHPDSGATLCSLGSDRPFSCAVSAPECIEDYCAMELRKVNFEELEL